MTRAIQESLVTGDGYVLAIHRYAPAGVPAGVVLVAPGMGIRQRFYTRFANWLAARGYLALTFDFRGIGESRPASLRHFPATLGDWIRLDCAAVIERAAVEANGRPLIWIGHSLGGQILPLVPNVGLVAKMVMVATGTGYWREHRIPARIPAWWLWHVASPLSLAVFGFFPGTRLRKVGDLPAGVMAQWRRWCLDPLYAAGAEGPAARHRYAEFGIPVYSLSFTDDEYMSARNTASLHALFVNAPLQAVRLTPAEAGLDRVGHFGFFRPRSERILWERFLLPALCGPDFSHLAAARRTAKAG